MKLFLLAFVALAAAESDPALYTNWYNGFYNTPSVYSTYNSYVPSTFYSGAYSPYVSTYHSIYKREADANHHLPYLYNPSVYNWSPYMTYRSPVVATTAGQPVFKNGNFHTNLHNVLDGTKAGGVGQVYQTQYKHLMKREADSDSFFPYSSYLPYSGVYHPNVYNSAAYTYPYTTTYANNYWNRLYKRDADSDSLLYTTSPYTYTPYSHGLYNYNNYYTSPYVNTYSNLYPRYHF